MKRKPYDLFIVLLHSLEVPRTVFIEDNINKYLKLKYKKFLSFDKKFYISGRFDMSPNYMQIIHS